MATTTTATVIAAFIVLQSVTAASGCTEELMLLSECLSYPPNSLTESPSDKCCNAFSSAAESLCVCYLLGDPLNNTKILSLSSLCPSPSPISISFPFLCSVSTVLPPFDKAPTTTLRISAAGGRSVSGGARIGSGISRSRGYQGSSGSTVPYVVGSGRGTSSNSNGSIFLTPPRNALLFSQILVVILLTLLTT